MIVSVTTLGSRAGAIGRAADHVVGYLEGDRSTKAQLASDSPSRAGSSAPDVDTVATGLGGIGSLGGYYADSAEIAGTWRGRGASAEGFDLGRVVDAQSFRSLLLGRDPNTGAQLVAAAGSSGRARGHSHGLSSVPSDSSEMLSAADAADIAGVDVSYIRRLAARTAEIRVAQFVADRSGEIGPETPSSYLDATKDDKGRWKVSREEAERFTSGRREPQVVLGYDITWSVPKSVSALYAQGTVTDRRAVDEAIEAAVTAGMDYLEREGFHVRSNGVRETAADMVAASYRHYTNRALEPQLHEHVVVANMATSSSGDVRAVDARGLFAHATTAGYLAAAELRNELAEALGIEWAEVHKGIADIEGVDRKTIMAISSRRQALLTLSEEMGFSSIGARQKAALATRPSKDHSVDAVELRDRWRQVLAENGFDTTAVEALHGRNDLRLWTPTDTDTMFRHLSGHRGVTEQAAIFDRREVLQVVATFANDRLSAAEIEDLADQWLGTDAVVPLEVKDGVRRETIGFGAAQVLLTPDEQRYTTPHMLEIERRTIQRHRSGISTGYGLVDPGAVEAAITSSSIDLGAEQAAMVRSITTSGDQFQAVIGRAGAGKTTAVQAAVSAWQHDGYNVIGAAPFAEAARNLEAETGLRSTTLAGLLTRIETAGDPREILGHNTVIVVDEASTIGNRQLDRLYCHAAETGATVRTIGDPHQHQSVEAGGLWKHLASQHPDHTPILAMNRRQAGHDMAQVRLALDEYRNGLIASAMHRLDDDSRIITAGNWEELLDTMAADWFVDHRNHLEGGAIESKMIAERNSDRHALNQRAQTLLHEAGHIGEPVLIGDTHFHVGDRVVAQAPNADLRADEAERRDHVINGSQGTITAVKGTRRDAELIVEFDNLGEIRVPHDFIATDVSPGRGGGLAPGYAVTSFKAEGQTYEAGRNLASPAAINTEGMYVALTRGRNDQRTYTISPDAHQFEPAELPVIADGRTAIEALAESLSRPRGTDLASVADPDAVNIAVQAARPLAGIEGRALTLAESHIAATAINDPDPVTIAALGPRPPVNAHRQVWDNAVGQAAIFRARWDSDEITMDGSVAAPSPCDGPDRHRDYGRVQRAVLAADAGHLDEMPLDQILAEHRSAQSSLPHSPDRDVRLSTDAVAVATEQLWTARERFDTAQHDHERAQTNPRGWRDPNSVEATRRCVSEATRAVAARELDLQRARRQLEASRGDSTGVTAVQARLAALDRSLDRRIADAVKRPASYIVETLGKRPDKQPDARSWDRTATRIETYRHRHLGITPQDGPQPGEGLSRAIGPRPMSLPLLRFWTAARGQIERQASEPQRHRAPVEQWR